MSVRGATPSEAGTGDALLATRTLDGDELPSSRGEVLPLRRGDTVGRYVVLELVGKGGMSVVYAAYDPQLDRRVALKVMRAREEDVAAAEDRKRLLREAQSIAKLSHPNVVGVHDVGTFDEDVFVAMEFVEGGTLRSWMESRTHDWRASAALLLQAGEGLQAAHDADLVHRDFKPENVMVGTDGRARVADFGLALPRSGEIRAAAEQPDASASQSRLTRGGAILGTPSYMAPELHEGARADPVSDQYSFCVTAYEVLYGQRPFASSTLIQRLAGLGPSEPDPPPRDSSVPRSIGAALVRGLQADPAARWPDMGALLAAIRPALVERASPWLRGGLVLGAVGLSAGIAATLAREPAVTPAEPCTDAADSIDGIWNPARTEAMSRQLTVSTGAGAWHRVGPQVDAWVESWRDAALSSCRAALVDGRLSGELFDLTVACLDARRAALETRLALVDEDPSTAPALIVGLPGIAECLESERLREVVALPVEPGRRHEVEAIERALSTIDAEVDVGRHQPALERIDALIQRAEASGHAPLIARTRGLATVLFSRVGQHARAEAEAQRALQAAAAGRDDLETARIWTNLAFLLSEQPGRLQDTLMASRAARAAIVRAGSRRHLELLRLGAEGIALFSAGDRAASIAVFEQAMALRDEGSVDELQLAGLLGNYGIVLQSEGRYDEAQAMFEDAYGREVTLSSGRHPSAAAVLHNLGNNALFRGDVADARRRFEASLEIQVAAVGEGSPQQASTLVGLAQVLMEEGALEDATATLGQAEAIYASVFGEAVPWAPALDYVRSRIARAGGYTTEALAHAEAAVRAMQRVGGDEQPDFGQMLAQRGIAEAELGRLGAAEASLTRGIETLASGYEQTHPMLAEPYAERGIVRQRRGDIQGARADLERAVSIYGRGVGMLGERARAREALDAL
ncbi:MAG: tetratricopeptide repeat protein [Myxococcota bacterium]